MRINQIINDWSTESDRNGVLCGVNKGAVTTERYTSLSSRSILSDLAAPRDIPSLFRHDWNTEIESARIADRNKNEATRIMQNVCCDIYPS